MTPSTMNDSHNSSFFGELNVVNYDYKSTQSAKKSAFEIRAVLEELRDHTTIPSVSRCFPYDYRYTWPELAQERFNSHTVYYSRCKNKNACPVCSRAADAKTRKDFSYEFDYFTSMGYRPYWQTYEAGFKPKVDSLSRIKTLNVLWRKLQQVKSFTSNLKHGKILSLRVTEFSYNGGTWTPHFHVVWLFARDMDQTAIDKFLTLASRIWRKKQAKEPRCIAVKRILDSAALDPVSTKTIAHYLFKCMYLAVDENGITLLENLKSPMDYLAAFVRTGAMEYLDAWLLYEQTSKGIRRYKFSKDWKAVASSR